MGRVVLACKCDEEGKMAAQLHFTELWSIDLIKEWFKNTPYLESDIYGIFQYFLKNFSLYLIELGYLDHTMV